MEVGAESRGDRAHFNRRARDPAGTRAPRKARLQRYPDLATPPSRDRRSEYKVNQIRRTVLHQRVKVRVKIHPFRLTLLLIHVRNPDQRCAPSRECLTNLRNEEVRDEARVETSRPKNEQISFSNRIECARSGFDGSHIQRYRCNASRSRKRRLAKDADAPTRAPA
jgi:hypothetical protein